MQGVAAANAEVVASVSAFVAAEGYVAEEMVFIMFVPDLEEFWLIVVKMLCYQRK